MISDATVITKWSSLTTPSILAPSPTTMLRRTRSFISRHRFHRICLVSIPNGVALLDMVVHQRCQKVIGRSDGMEITGKMQV